MSNITGRIGQFFVGLQFFYQAFSSASFHDLDPADLNSQLYAMGIYVSTVLASSIALIALSSMLSELAGTINRVGELVELFRQYDNGSIHKIPVEGEYQDGDYVEFKDVTFYNPGGKMIVQGTTFPGAVTVDFEPFTARDLRVVQS